MNKLEVGFVILHYVNMEETIKSIEYIQENIDTDLYHIVVVDNGSGNGTGEILAQKYRSANISILLLPENIGFARGNNHGISWLRKQFFCEFIVLLNNDVYLIEKQFYSKVKSEYEKSRFALLGPLILTGRGKCNINPGRKNVITEMEVRRKIKRYKRQLCLSRIHLNWLFEWAIKVYNQMYYYPKMKKNTPSGNKAYIERMENVQLHGCFMVFSDEFFRSFQGLDGRTFLYMEEDILFAQLCYRNLKTVYNPQIVIYHQEDAATDSAKGKKLVRKKQFVWKNYLLSANVLLDVLHQKN